MATLSLLVTFAYASRPPFTGAFPWQRVPTMCQTSLGGIFTRSKDIVGTGRLTDAVVTFLAENYDLIVASDLDPGNKNATCEESKVAAFANRVAAVNPHARVLVYNANQLHHGADVPPPETPPPPGYMCGLDGFRPEWRATYDNGTAYVTHRTYVHNLSIPAARAWWLGVVTNKSLGAHVAGVFADGAMDQAPNWCSAERAAALLRGQQLLLDEVRAAGKYIIFNGLRLAYTRGQHPIARDDFAAIDTLLPHASAGYCEPWLSGPYRNVSGALDAPYATHALLRMINASRTQPDRGVTFKIGPGQCQGYIAGQDLGCTWPFANGTKSEPNKMNGTPLTAAGRRAAAAKLITFPLATFLCAAGPRWHIDYTWGYTVNDFVPNDNVTGAFPGQPKLQSNAPDEWYPDLLKAPGTPLGECVYDSATQSFSREWSGVSVTLSMANETAELRWK